jgi:DNA-binding transcriptional MerR regulator
MRIQPPGLSVAAAARRLGIAPATLRTWDRRYGIGPTDHLPGRHRRFSPDDLARLELMRQELVRGVSPAEAAEYARTASLPGADAELSTERADDDEATLGPPGADKRALGLARAALALDESAVRELLVESVDVVGVETTWNDLVRPVLRAVADRWSYTGTGVEIEHMLSECVGSVFGAHAGKVSLETDVRPVLLAGMPGEQHILPMTVLAAALVDRGVPCRGLGANLPAGALAAAIRRTAPSVVALWAQVPGSADVDVLRALPRTRPRFRTYATGPGWAGVTLPPQIGRLDALGIACDTISAAALA